MGYVAKNARSTFSSALNGTDTTVVFATGHGTRFALGVGEYTYIWFQDASNNLECVKLTAVSGDSGTIVRAQDGTSARSWNIGDIIECRPCAAAVNDLQTATATAQSTATSASSAASAAQGTADAALPKAGGTMTGDLTLGAGVKVVFEGATNDAHELTLTVDDPTSDVTVTLPAYTGKAAVYARGADIASASTINLTTTTGDIVDVTGTTGITAITLADGLERSVRFTGSLTLTHGASLVLPGAANITTADGDVAVFRGYAAGVVRCVSYTTASGLPLVNQSASLVGAFRSLVVSATGSGANVSVSYDEIVLEDSSNTYVTRRAGSLTINTAASGANGLDTGTLAGSTWYALWVISKADGTTAGLISTSATTPTLPSGYTFKARIGWIRTDGTANKYPLGFKQYGADVQYIIAPATNLTTPPRMASGSATWAATAVGAFVPPTAAIIRGAFYHNTNSQTGIAPNANYGAPGGTEPIYNSAYTPTNGTNIYTVHPYEVLLESSDIYWYATSGSSYLDCLGWRDNL